MIHQYMRYNDHVLRIRVNFVVKCVCVGFGLNGFVTKTQPFPMDGYSKMDIISGVSYPRSDSIVLLVLCMVACNGWSIGIVL